MQAEKCLALVWRLMPSFEKPGLRNTSSSMELKPVSSYILFFRLPKSGNRKEMTSIVLRLKSHLLPISYVVR